MPCSRCGRPGTANCDDQPGIGVDHDLVIGGVLVFREGRGAVLMPPSADRCG